jgi:hypothetical protein
MKQEIRVTTLNAVKLGNKREESYSIIFEDLEKEKPLEKMVNKINKNSKILKAKLV